MAKLLRQIAPWLFAVLLPSALPGQTPIDTAAAVRAAQTATQTWLALVDSGQVAKGWEQAATSLQRAQTTAAFAHSS